MSYADRYAIATRSSNLRSNPDTTHSDSDVLGAAGLAGKKAPLAMALCRLLSGDNHASREIVELMAGMLDGKAYRLRVQMSRLEAKDVSRAVLAWSRDGTCKVCNGHGFQVIEGAPSLSEHRCQSCDPVHRGKRPFMREFATHQLELARWLLAEVEREMAIGWGLAAAKIAPKLYL